MEKWFVTMKKADFNDIAEAHGISPITARLIRNRDVVGNTEIHNYLYGTLDDLSDPMLLKDSIKAAEIVKDKLAAGKKVRIIGDYDIDGVNASYILYVGLKKLGVAVDIDIPDRIKDGYGINEQLIEKACQEKVDTIITCDNGIAALDQVSYAKAQGMTVIITDHHELGFQEEDGERIFLVPQADAVINPKQPDCAYPFKHLCGAAVAYRFLEVLYQYLGEAPSCLLPLVENVAIATVGDVMDLVGENRIYVKTGLKMLKSTQNKGLKALIDINNLDINKLSAYHIGFVIGPCLNAGGRLDSAKRAFEMLVAETVEEAEVLAGDLKALNDSRKDMTSKSVEAAIEQVESEECEKDKVLVIYLPDCHESLAGIVAGRLREKYHKPVFVLTKGEEGIKGSGRSIENYHMFDEMNKCKELFTKFGGHPMAAGLSMEEKHIEKFRQTMNENTSLIEDDFIPKVSIDIPMPIDYITEEIINEITLLEPFGKANPKPVFAEKDLIVEHIRILGKNQNVLKLMLKNQKKTRIEGMYFGNVDDFFAYITKQYGTNEVNKALAGQPNEVQLSITYNPGINEYMGKRNLQLTILNYR